MQVANNFECYNCGLKVAEFNFNKKENECISCAPFKKIKSAKGPFVSGRTYGVEFEVVTVDNMDYEGWARKYDGSIYGWEYVSPIFSGYEKPMKMVKEFCAAAKKYSKIDKSCGLHLHIGTKDFKSPHLDNLIYNAYKNQDTVYKIVHKARKKSEYCERLYYDNYSEHDNLTVDRYHWLNTMSDYDTAEIRVHEGTLDPIRVEHWIDLWLSFFEYSKVARGNTLLEILDKIGTRKSTINYFRKILDDQLC